MALVKEKKSYGKSRNTELRKAQLEKAGAMLLICHKKNLKSKLVRDGWLEIKNRSKFVWAVNSQT